MLGHQARHFLLNIGNLDQLSGARSAPWNKFEPTHTCVRRWNYGTKITQKVQRYNHYGTRRQKTIPIMVLGDLINSTIVGTLGVIVCKGKPWLRPQQIRICHWQSETEQTGEALVETSGNSTVNTDIARSRV